jgi:hypothetical protein
MYMYMYVGDDLHYVWYSIHVHVYAASGCVLGTVDHHGERSRFSLTPSYLHVHVHVHVYCLFLLIAISSSGSTQTGPVCHYSYYAYMEG